MKDQTELFADLTSAIEDLHGISVEGQAPDISLDFQLSLLASIKIGITIIENVVAQISHGVAATKL